MNYSCYNHKLNSIDQNNLQNYVLSDRTTAQFNSIHEVQQSKLKTKAYINPHVFNYEYIKKSLSQGSFSTTNKIHFNPYFKNNGSNSFKKDEDRMLPLRSTEFASRSWGIKKENNPTSKVLSENKKMHFVKLASKYKLINKKDLMHNQQPHQSKYSWSKERLINESSFCNKLSKTSLKKGPANLNKEHAVLNKKSDNLTPANQFRINTSRNLSKISNLTCKALEKKPPPIYLTKMKIINLSSKKLVNSYASTIKPNLKLSSNKIWSNQAKFCYNKTKCLIKVASLVRNKYKYYRGANSQKGSKYKLDKRKKLSVNLSKKPSLIETNDIGKLFPNPHKTKYFYLKPQPSRFFKKKNSASWSWR